MVKRPTDAKKTEIPEICFLHFSQPALRYDRREAAENHGDDRLTQFRKSTLLQHVST